MWRERKWQTSGKKTSEMAHLSGRFCFHILKNMAQNNNEYTGTISSVLSVNFSFDRVFPLEGPNTQAFFRPTFVCFSYSKS